MLNKFFQIVLSLFLLLLLFHSCDFLMNSEDEPVTFGEKLFMIENVKWYLSEIKFGDEILGAEDYDWCYIGFGRDTIWGRDNCNSFYGSFTFDEASSIFTNNFRITEVACPGREIFPVSCLNPIFHLDINKNKIYISKNDTVFTFSSEYAEMVFFLPFIEKEYILFDSNDENFIYLKQYDFIPSIKFLKNRRGYLKWYLEQSDNYSTTYIQTFHFGIKDNNSINFYRYLGNRGLDALNTPYDDGLINGIYSSNKIDGNEHTVTLYNIAKGIYYKFISKK